MRLVEIRPGVVLALLAAVTLVSRLPFLTPRLAHWDAVNYALGLHDFNVAAHQPHPPGSPYYILLGRAALALTGDDNAALILVSLISSVGAVVGVYALASLVFQPRAGLVAAVLLLTQPIFWGYGTMATPWTLLALLGLTIGVSCLLLLRGKRELVIPSALLVGMASGFRLDATIFLSPLWAWSMCRAESDWRRRLLALALVPACVLIWLVPVAASTSGGPSGWSDRMLALIVPADTSADQLTRQLVSNTFISFGTLALVVGPAVLLSLAADRRSAVSWLRTTLSGVSGLFWMLWIAPAFLYLWLFDSTEPGHALLFSVALCTLGAGLMCACARDLSRLVGYVALLAAAQIAVFLYAAPRADRAPPWGPNSMLLNVTASGLHHQQSSLTDSLQVIRSQFDPRDSVVLTLSGQDPYRFMMYYLPDYLVLNLDPAAPVVVSARGRRQGQRQVTEGCLFADSGVRHAVLVLWARSEPGLVPPEATLVSTADEAPFQVWEVQPAPDTPDYLDFKIGGPACLAARGPDNR